jgi:hypothetical protein
VYRQFQLRHDDARMTCWLLATDRRLKPGALVRLKNDPVPERFWEVAAVSHTQLEQPPDTRWQVGGLL